jgi:hypothetical protein
MIGATPPNRGSTGDKRLPLILQGIYLYWTIDGLAEGSGDCQKK